MANVVQRQVRYQLVPYQAQQSEKGTGPKNGKLDEKRRGFNNEFMLSVINLVKSDR